MVFEPHSPHGGTTDLRLLSTTFGGNHGIILTCFQHVFPQPHTRIKSEPALPHEWGTAWELWLE